MAKASKLKFLTVLVIKLQRHKKPKSIKSTIVRASTSKSKTNKLKSLRRENIQFLSKLGFKVKKN